MLRSIYISNLLLFRVQRCFLVNHCSQQRQIREGSRRLPSVLFHLHRVIDAPLFGERVFKPDDGRHMTSSKQCGTNGPLVGGRIHNNWVNGEGGSFSREGLALLRVAFVLRQEGSNVGRTVRGAAGTP